VLQRVTSARVRVGGSSVGSIASGLVVLLGVERGDTEAECDRLAERTATFRCFGDDAQRMSLSLVDTGGAALVVSQFTLAADTGAGRRPSFDGAEEPERARLLYERFAERLRALGVAVETGRFAARMEVELVNDGPVTFVLDTR
jgi:D-tyrosyl-tRNA(Tyr) deacylase